MTLRFARAGDRRAATVVGVRTAGDATTGRWMRLVLLLCTLVGLAAMHTLGHGAHATGTHATGTHATATHATGTHGSAAHAAATRTFGGHGSDADTSGMRAVGAGKDVAGSVVEMAAGAVSGHVVPPVAVPAGLADGCPGDGCARALTVPLGPLGGDLAGWSVCLAVLGGFALVLLVAVLLRRRSAGGGSAPGARPASGPRTPPPRPVGLRLATASVLRR